MKRTPNFNPRVYEEHLSPFGRKVLNELIIAWNKEVQRRPNNQSCDLNSRMPSRSRGSYVHKPHELLFNNQQPTIPADNNIEHERIPFIFDFTEKTSISKPKTSTKSLKKTTIHNLTTSAELIQPVSTDLHNGNTSSDDLLQYVVKSPTIGTKCGDVPSRDALILNRDNELVLDNYEERNKDEFKIVSEQRYEEEPFEFVRPSSDNINWNDMFDSELFSETNILNKENIENVIVKETKIKNDISPKDKKPKKRNSVSKNLCTTFKKVKTPQIEISKQLSYRKQKYTKTVKNWLENVDSTYTEEVIKPPKAIDENTNDVSGTMGKQDVITEKVPIQTKKKTSLKGKEYSLTIEKAPKHKITKKVVQAQLANKDGIMKFSSPKQNYSNKMRLNQQNDSNKVEQVTSAQTKSSTSESNTKTQDKSKSVSNNKPSTKTTKSSFVAPVKSQIPVKDVRYEVVSIDENNFADFKRTALESDKKDVTMVLSYRNGYCQLNEQHTEDPCTPEGIMIHYEDRFYYLQASKEHLDVISKILENNNIICYEAKPIFIYLKTVMALELYRETSYDVIDVKIGGCLLEPDNSPNTFSELQKLLSYTVQFTIATECVLQKTCWYSTLLQDCASILKASLVENSLWNLFVEVEMPLVPIIADMESRGVCVDMNKLREMESLLLAKMKEVEQLCYKVAGKVFQINSPLQVRQILYDELHLDEKCNLKVRETIIQGAKSTSETVLRVLGGAHELPRLVLEYRRLHKAHSTFLAGVAHHVTDGVIKPTWVQTAAATGRIASKNPNLQAIPKAPFSLAMYNQPDTTECPCVRFRSVYVCRWGHTLLAADFKQVECRVFAHAAQDVELLHALENGEDIFVLLATKWLKKPAASVSAADRERTKRIVYASLYGAGPRKLMDILEVQREQAACIAHSFNESFRSVGEFWSTVWSQCVSRGGRVRSVGGRARALAGRAGDGGKRPHAQRQAVNFVIQGSAADLCKRAMVRAVRAVSRAGARARLLLQIHDELVWEVHSADLHTAAAAIKSAMESCGVSWGVRCALPVAVARGADWGHLQPYTAAHTTTQADLLCQTTTE